MTRGATTRVLGLYLVSRVWSTGLLLTWFGLAHRFHWRIGNVPRFSDFATFLDSWDGAFYLRIAAHGYPVPLPLDAAGRVIGGEWAFFPLYPLLVRAFAAYTTLPLPVAAVVVSTLAGGAAALALHRLLSLRVPGRPALWGTVLFCFGPLSFLLEAGYAESLFLFLLFAALVALVRRRYAAVFALGLLLAFTRPGALALAVAIAVQVGIRITTDPPFRRSRALVAALATGLAVAAAGASWPVVAAVATGVGDAYLQTEMAWWAASIGRGGFVPLTPWFRMSSVYLGAAGAVVVVAALGLGAWWLTRRRLRVLGFEVLGFAWAYCAYLFAVFLPQQSLLRLLMPLAPLGADQALVGTARRRRFALGACLVLQPVAVVLLFCVWFP